MTTIEAGSPVRSTPRRTRHSALGNHVAATVGRLQARLQRDSPDPAAVSALARLRRVIGRDPGTDYTLEEYLYVPDDLLDTRQIDPATDQEHAVHDAVSLYALHQQSRPERMHIDGRGLGRAVADLVHVSNGPDGVRRRFAALGTASTYQESIYHLRGLITMLRGHQIPLDYGLLAEDLCTLRRPDGRQHVQAIWGREFFRSRPRATTDSDNADTSEETPA
ncbi:type I-E CRISPR-associated protein Cse2/CasB [Actinoplanes solisilvae]|uniref:type I-E CRISPR-associated protein Cse2/CasB n=1 Tax=Actinoplanes solisilvae TaxID=2486853 RepID=UPI000FDA432C|nr:type I-E CRISPR-associated protein Cse2/CasB [Actinoplanes solisilvae]